MRTIIFFISIIFLIITANGFSEILSTEDLLNKADSVFHSRDYQKARDYYLQVVEAAEKENDNSLLTEAYSMVARSYLILSDQENGKYWIEKAGKIASQDEPLGWSRYLGVRGRFEWQDNKLEKATSTFKKMYNYCSEHELYERAIDAAHMVAITSPPEEQVEWALKGISEAEKGKVTGWLGPLWNNLGATYEDLKQYDNALDAYLKAREYHWLYGNEFNKLVADWAVGHAYRLNGNYEEAGKWIRPVLAWCKRIDEIEFQGWCYNELAEIALANANNEKALEHYKKAEEFLQQAGMPQWDSEGYQELKDKIKSLE